MVCLRHRPGCLRWIAHYYPLDARGSSERRQRSRLELRVYHAVPGKMPDSSLTFATHGPTAAKHDLKVVGYWCPKGARLGQHIIYLVLIPAGGGEKNWDGMRADPQFKR